MAYVNCIKNRYKVNPMIFNIILKANEFKLVKTDNLDKWARESDFLSDNGRCIYDEDHRSMIIRQSAVYYHCSIKSDNYYGKPCIVYSDDSVDLKEKVRFTPYATECTKYIKDILRKDYTDEEIEDELNKHSVSDHYLPLHKDLPIYYDYNNIHSFNNCYYYDINNAHLEALTEIFSKSAKRLTNIRLKINELKFKGDYMRAQLLKDYINIYVGNLGRKVVQNNVLIGYADHRPTYEWVVCRTKKKLEDLIAQADGELLYANTDGFIIHNPKNLIEISTDLGKCKQENTTDQVWAFKYRDFSRNYTSYWCYQYYVNGKLITKGNLCNELRDKLDLPNGIYPIYKKTKINNHFEYLDIQLCKGEIKIWP